MWVPVLKKVVKKSQLGKKRSSNFSIPQIKFYHYITGRAIFFDSLTKKTWAPTVADVIISTVVYRRVYSTILYTEITFFYISSAFYCYYYCRILTFVGERRRFIFDALCSVRHRYRYRQWHI
jgi:hypothetical protein